MEYKALPDLKHLETLKAVVELGGVAQAARKLNVGQPAVTKRLRALDNCYGVNLMYREGRQLELTEAGELVYYHARMALDQQNTLFEDLEALQGGKNKLRLETTFAIGEHLLPDLLLKYSELHPDFQIETRMGYSRRIQTRLATGLSDLALLEQAPEHPDILVQEWLNDEIVLVCGPGHHLYQSHSIEPDMLQNLRFVMREPNSSMRLTLDAALANIGIYSLPITMEVGSTDTITGMLQRGQHVSFLPHFAVVESVDRGRLHRIKIHGLHISRTLWIARTKSSSSDRVADTFIQVLLDGS
jgi:DNA-binding transcriptional LysR family regulator